MVYFWAIIEVFGSWVLISVLMIVEVVAVFVYSEVVISAVGVA